MFAWSFDLQRKLETWGNACYHAKIFERDGRNNKHNSYTYKCARALTTIFSFQALQKQRGWSTSWRFFLLPHVWTLENNIKLTYNIFLFQWPTISKISSHSRNVLVFLKMCSSDLKCGKCNTHIHSWLQRKKNRPRKNFISWK